MGFAKAGKNLRRDHRYRTKPEKSGAGPISSIPVVEVISVVIAAAFWGPFLANSPILRGDSLRLGRWFAVGKHPTLGHIPDPVTEGTLVYCPSGGRFQVVIRCFLGVRAGPRKTSESRPKVDPNPASRLGGMGCDALLSGLGVAL